ncbi:hypothetical protein BD414DRAFT_163636 [Trametes punicea]|nr:hypothetical protein BD414DRAFT_163636 [Trametes punicea]
MVHAPIAVPRLPAEIDYLIIDHLSDDMAALSSCSLVCSSWLSVARSHLFRTLAIGSTATDGRFAAFEGLLKKRTHFGPLIQELILRCRPFSSFNEDEKAEQVDVAVLQSIVVMLPALRRLTLDGISLPPRNCGFAMLRRPSLVSMRIIGCRFHDENLQSALNAMCIFETIEELSIEGFWIAPCSSSLANTLPSPTTLRHIHLNQLGSSANKLLCDFLGTVAHLTSLQSVHLTWYTWSEVTECQLLLSHVAQNLKRLELEPTDDFWEREVQEDDNRWDKLGLARCTQLETLCLHTSYSYLSYRTDGHKWFFAAVATYVSHVLLHYQLAALRHLILKIPVYPRNGEVRIAHVPNSWEPLDSALSRRRSLMAVTLEIRSPCMLSKLSKETLSLSLRRALARTNQRGILQIVFVYMQYCDDYDDYENPVT